MSASGTIADRKGFPICFRNIKQCEGGGGVNERGSMRWVSVLVGDVAFLWWRDNYSNLSFVWNKLLYI